jgi:hypothetical protein
MDPEVQEAIDNVKKHATARKVTKFVVGAIVGHCAAVVAKTAIRNVVLEDPSKTERLKMDLGCYAIGGVVGTAAKQYVGEDIDAAFDTFEAVKRGLKKKSPAPVTETIVVTPSE